MIRTTVSQADLADKTQEVIERVQHGEVVVVESCGKEQMAVLDPLDLRLLQALAQCAVHEKEWASDDPDVTALQRYLGGKISLGKASELLGLNRFELQERFLRLGVRLRLGPATLEEARADVATALKFG